MLHSFLENSRTLSFVIGGCQALFVLWLFLMKPDPRLTWIIIAFNAVLLAGIALLYNLPLPF